MTPPLYILEIESKGRGVFCAADLPAGSLIEICPVIVLPETDRSTLDRTHLHDYYFVWQDGTIALALGYGSLYNHSPAPNAETRMDATRQTLDLYALQDIAAGTEIVIDYQAEGKLWFEVR